jgi:hypothetical protein
MAEDPLREVIESVRTTLQAELEAQLSAVAARQEQAVRDARRQAEAEADARWSSLLEERRAEGQQQLQAALAAARADVEQRVAAEVTRVRIDADRQLAEETRRLRADLDRSAHGSAPVLDAFRQIDAAATVSTGLNAIASAAAAAAPRAALFIADGSELTEWGGSSLQGMAGASSATGEGPALIVQALEAAATVRDKQAVAVPLMLEGRPVGVVYGQAANGDGSGEPWAEALELIARHGASHLGYLTAVRTAQLRDWISRAPASASTAGQDEAVQSARRYARLLVSEIKLYNEAAVREARGPGELQARFGPEIDRARRLYEERVPATVPDRARHFYQELVQTLAGGDASRLG